MSCDTEMQIQPTYVVHLLADHLATLLDDALVAIAVQNEGVVLGDGDLLARSKLIKGGGLELEANVFADDLKEQQCDKK